MEDPTIYKFTLHSWRTQYNAQHPYSEGRERKVSHLELSETREDSELHLLEL